MHRQNRPRTQEISVAFRTRIWWALAVFHVSFPFVFLLEPLLKDRHQLNDVEVRSQTKELLRYA